MKRVNLLKLVVNRFPKARLLRPCLDVPLLVMRSFAGVIAAAAGLAAILSAQTEPEVRTLESNGRLIRYQVRGGFAVVQGDIIIGTAAEVEAAHRAANRKSL